MISRLHRPRQLPLAVTSTQELCRWGWPSFHPSPLSGHCRSSPYPRSALSRCWSSHCWSSGGTDVVPDAFADTPEFQIQQLAKKTRDYGVAYAEIQFGKILGKGSQGEVFLANWRGIAVAVKKVNTSIVPPEIIDEFCAEADIMRRLRHPCLTLFMGVSLEQPYLCIVTELVNRGSLFDILQEESTGFTWRRALQIMTDIASGIAYLHSFSPPIIHRDLKSLNVLVTSNWRGKVAG